MPDHENRFLEQLRQTLTTGSQEEMRNLSEAIMNAEQRGYEVSRHEDLLWERLTARLERFVMSESTLPEIVMMESTAENEPQMAVTVGETKFVFNVRIARTPEELAMIVPPRTRVSMDLLTELDDLIAGVQDELKQSHDSIGTPDGENNRPSTEQMAAYTRIFNIQDRILGPLQEARQAMAVLIPSPVEAGPTAFDRLLEDDEAALNEAEAAEAQTQKELRVTMNEGYDDERKARQIAIRKNDTDR